MTGPLRGKMMNEQARNIIDALLTLAGRATFNCDLDGAEKITALRQAAIRTVQELTALIDATAEEAEEEAIENE